MEADKENPGTVIFTNKIRNRDRIVGYKRYIDTDEDFMKLFGGGNS